MTTVATATFAACGITGGSASLETINVTVGYTDTTFTATVGTGSLSHTFTGPEATKFAGGAAVGMATGNVGDKITTMVATVSQAAANTLTIYTVRSVPRRLTTR